MVALAAIGNLGKFVCEELIADGRFDVVVLTRQVKTEPLIFRAQSVHSFDVQKGKPDPLTEREPIGTDKRMARGA